MGMRISPLQIKILLESNPLKSRIFVRRLAVQVLGVARKAGCDTYMRNLLGWLETRLAQITINDLKIA